MLVSHHLLILLGLTRLVGNHKADFHAMSISFSQVETSLDPRL